jgi:hypothetical protein
MLYDRAKSYLNLIRQKDALITLLNEWGPADWFVTLRFNNEVSYTGARHKLRQFHAQLDRQLLGKHWSRSADRTQFIAVAEKRDGTLHYHLLVKLPLHPREGVSWLYEAERIWRRIVPSGTFFPKPVGSAQGPERTSNYMGKDAWRDVVMEHYVLSSEFVGWRKENTA